MFEFYYNFRNCIRKKIMMTQYDFLRFLVCKLIFPIVFLQFGIDYLVRLCKKSFVKIENDSRNISDQEESHDSDYRPSLDLILKKKNESHSKTTKTNINASLIFFHKMIEIFTQHVKWKKANWLSDLNRWKIHNHDSL